MQRVQEAGNELALHVAFEESLVVFVEELLAVERVCERREAAARDAGHDVDLVQHPRRLPVDDEGGPAQLLQHAERERRRARSAAGKREDDERVRCSSPYGAPSRAVARGGICGFESGVDGARCAAGEERGDENERHGAGKGGCHGVHGNRHAHAAQQRRCAKQATRVRKAARPQTCRRRSARSPRSSAR